MFNENEQPDLHVHFVLYCMTQNRERENSATILCTYRSATAVALEMKMMMMIIDAKFRNNFSFCSLSFLTYYISCVRMYFYIMSTAINILKINTHLAFVFPMGMFCFIFTNFFSYNSFAYKI